MNTNSKPQNDTPLAHLNDPSARSSVHGQGSDPNNPNETHDDDTVLAHINGPAATDAEKDDEADDFTPTP